jgi:hypothetical protein
MQERRRHVRAKPVPELPARVLHEVTPPIAESLDVVDISVTGLAIAYEGQPEWVAGSTKRLKLVLPDGTHEIACVVRWSSKGMTGLELVDPSENAAKAIRRYVGELLERGSAA